jgi:hypothetical protein
MSVLLNRRNKSSSTLPDAVSEQDIPEFLRKDCRCKETPLLTAEKIKLFEDITTQFNRHLDDAVKSGIDIEKGLALLRSYTQEALKIAGER